jgi:alanine racemase
LSFRSRPTVARVDLGAIVSNFHRIRDGSRSRVLAVVKANAYGHGAAPVARALEAAGADFFCVAIAEEGIELRRAGIRSPILMLNFGSAGDVAVHRAFGLTPTLGSVAQIREFAAATARYVEPLSVHLKIDTGLTRLGILPDEAAEAARLLAAAPGLRVEAAFSHFSHGEDPSHPTRELQTRAAHAAFGALRGAGLSFGWTHLANSGASLAGPEHDCDAVRPGLLLYGVAPGAPVPGMRPALSWETEVAALKEVGAGVAVGYGGTFVTARPSRLAVLPIGYDDGYRRSFSGRVPVLLPAGPAPTVGVISMDLTVCDATDAGASPGDRVVLLGATAGGSVGAHDLARAASTIPYEILCGIRARVPRAYA